MTPRDREALERIFDCIEAIDAYVSRARRYRSRQPARPSSCGRRGAGGPLTGWCCDDRQRSGLRCIGRIRLDAMRVAASPTALDAATRIRNGGRSRHGHGGHRDGGHAGTTVLTTGTKVGRVATLLDAAGRGPVHRPDHRDNPLGPLRPLATRVGAAVLLHILSLGLRNPLVRRLLARMRWPRPEHVDRMRSSEFQGYVRAIGVEAEAQKALADFMGGRDSSEADTGLRSPEGRSERRAPAVVP